MLLGERRRSNKMSVTLLIAVTGIAAVSYIAARDHRAANARRRGLLDECSAVLDRSKLSHRDDGFPILSGSHRGRGVHVDLVLDTMTIRRLPQLWQSTTLLDRHPGLPGFSIVVRHCGTEFYSLLSRFQHRLDAPLGLPSELVIRGDIGGGALLDELGPLIARILEDPRVKEIAVTDRGVRIVRQAAEGKRGDYLLLRQSVFESARLTGDDFAAVLEQLHAVRSKISSFRQADAA
jgi:hypothetical protein